MCNRDQIPRFTLLLTISVFPNEKPLSVANLYSLACVNKVASGFMGQLLEVEIVVRTALRQAPNVRDYNKNKG